VLHRMGEFREAAQLYSKALRLTPAEGKEVPNLHYNLGNTFMDLAIQTDVQLLRESVQHYIECLSRDAVYPGAMNNLGNALKEMDLFIPALRAWQTALRLKAGDPDVFSNMVHLRMFICDWDGWLARYSALEDILTKQLLGADGEESGVGGGEAQVRSKRKTLSCQPFHALLYARLPPPLVLAIARSFAREVVDNTRHFPAFHRGPSPPPLPLPPTSEGWSRRPSLPRMRIGYLSHDFGDHPTGHLFNSVPWLHLQGGRVEAVYFTLKGHEDSRLLCV